MIRPAETSCPKETVKLARALPSKNTKPNLASTNSPLPLPKKWKEEAEKRQLCNPSLKESQSDQKQTKILKAFRCAHWSCWCIINLDISCIFQDSANNWAFLNLISHPKRKLKSQTWESLSFSHFQLGKCSKIFCSEKLGIGISLASLYFNSNISPSCGFLRYFHTGESLPTYIPHLVTKLHCMTISINKR